jgi:hypothetical protein
LSSIRKSTDAESKMNRHGIAKDMADRLRRCDELQAHFESLTPDERAEFDELCDEKCAEFDWAEIRQRIQDGSMSAEQADRWLNELAQRIAG